MTHCGTHCAVPRFEREPEKKLSQRVADMSCTCNKKCSNQSEHFLIQINNKLPNIESNSAFVASIFSLVTSFPGSPLAVTKNKNWGSGLGFVIVRGEPGVNKAIHQFIHYTHLILTKHLSLLFTSEVCGCDKWPLRVDSLTLVLHPWLSTRD